MTTSMKQTVIKNPTWWKGRSALERGLTIIAFFSVLLVIALAVSIAVVVANSGSCDVSESSAVPAKTEMLPSTAEALKGLRLRKRIQTVREPKMVEVCYTPECVHTASTILKNMDADVDPCDDFYRFACGGFLKSTIIPDDKTSINTFSIIRDKLREQLRPIIEAESEPNEPKPFKLVKDLYESCMNKTAIEAKGLGTLEEIWGVLGRWPVLMDDSWKADSFNLFSKTFLLRLHGYPSNYFIDFRIGVHPKNSTIHVIHLDQAALGLPREYLLNGFNDTIVSAYYSYMVEIAVILGAKRDRAMKELKESLNFEIELANISLSNEKRRNAAQLYNPMTFADLTEKFPIISWGSFINQLKDPFSTSATIEEDEVAIVNVPSYIAELEKLMNNTPKKIQANYLMWRVVMDSVDYLPDVVREKQTAYFTVLNGRMERESRWKECVDVVSHGLPISVGSMYVRKYFNEEAKKSAVEMVMDIRQQFKQILEKVDWMDGKTRKSALEKAASMASHIAYPDELLDDNKLEEFYKDLEFSADLYLENVLNLTLFETDYSFSKLRKPVNKTDWLSHARPAIVNAFYSSIENSIQFPAGILQGAFLSNDRPKYMNYGAIGFLIGHEITHGFDDQGRQFDKNGNLVDWSEPSTNDNFLKRAACIVNQYGNYTVEEVHLNLNGTNTQGGNIADNGGIKAAYLAYNDWAARNGPEQQLPGINRTPQQMFWISAANAFCAKSRPEKLKLEITTGLHSPEEFRILGPLSNMPEFATDFQCPVRSKMNPKDKCSFW